MAEPNYGAAAQQTVLMLQKINKDVQLVENLDAGLDKMFSSVGPGDEIGLQNYRLPLQMETGAIGGYYNPDGGTYPQGAAAQYDQMILAPQPIILAFTVTELARRISKAGMDVTVRNWVAKMIADAKKKASHFRNAYLQDYNNGLLARSMRPTPVADRRPYLWPRIRLVAGSSTAAISCRRPTRTSTSSAQSTCSTSPKTASAPRTR